MDSVRIEWQDKTKNWKIHVPGQPDIFASDKELAELISALDETKK